jgi:catechol 2,3-dioxygenase-like lactoylglutathione lyase family enzyme
MKRMHLHIGVADLDTSIAFYTGLFGAAPTIAKPDYAKWMLDDPHVNFAISSVNPAVTGIEHIGIQAETPDELGEIYARLKAAGRPVLEEGSTTCCYATSDKNWVTDPDGVVWEAFLTDGQSTVYGDRMQVARAHANLDALEAAHASAATCCVPGAA